MKTDIINARVEPALKASAEQIFRTLGLTTTDAISIFLSQVVLNKGLPFQVKIPNETTRAAITEMKQGKTRVFTSSKALMNEILK